MSSNLNMLSSGGKVMLAPTGVRASEGTTTAVFSQKASNSNSNQVKDQYDNGENLGNKDQDEQVVVKEEPIESTVSPRDLTTKLNPAQQ